MSTSSSRAASSAIDCRTVSVPNQVEAGGFEFATKAEALACVLIVALDSAVAFVVQVARQTRLPHQL